MRVVIQRVSEASVTIKKHLKSSIQTGIVVLLGIESADTNDDIEWLCGKIAGIRIFNDATGVMNRSILEVDGEVLLISQFTLFAGTKKGNRPSYSRAAKSEMSEPMYESFIKCIQLKLGKKIQTGTFGADMKVSLINDGPVTILIDSKNKE